VRWKLRRKTNPIFQQTGQRKWQSNSHTLVKIRCCEPYLNDCVLVLADPPRKRQKKGGAIPQVDGGWDEGWAEVGASPKKESVLRGATALPGGPLIISGGGHCLGRQ